MTVVVAGIPIISAMVVVVAVRRTWCCHGGRFVIPGDVVVPVPVQYVLSIGK